jgi:hypothetical protein
MSWKVRKVFTRKLVDAQYCATLLLLAVPFCVLGLIFAYTIRLYPTPHYGLVGIIIIIYSYIVLGFLYGHKVYYYVLFYNFIIIKLKQKYHNTTEFEKTEKRVMDLLENAHFSHKNTSYMPEVILSI